MQEKRRIQRVSFDTPLEAQLGPARVWLCDLSTTGARIEHRTGFAPGGAFLLAVDWRGEHLELRAVVTRCRLGQSRRTTALRYDCGLRFAEMSRTARTSLHRILAELVESSLAHRSGRHRTPHMAS